MHKRGERSLLGEKIGPYFIKDRLGQGGMGAVYLAQDMALDRMVALKVLLPRLADDAEFIARFQREARASAKLNHPNIVQVYTVDVESDPPYLVMEYVAGQNLETHIRARKQLPWRDALNVVGQVASALDCAHRAGIIHRDIKPANVLVEKGGRIRVTDFGIAKIMGSETKLTATQHTVGSPCYMSPEQCGVGELVPASDLFSLGIMLYEMLTGSVPFKADTSIAVMRKITDEDVPPVSANVEGIPPTLDHLLQALTARDVTLRYDSATQVLEDLKSFQAGDTLHHFQSLSLQKAAHAPASASAADLTRSPTGTGVVLSDSLVEGLFEGTRSTVERPRPKRGIDVEIPWMGIFVTAALVLFAVLAMLYYKDRVENPPPRPPESPRDFREGRPPSQGAHGPWVFENSVWRLRDGRGGWLGEWRPNSNRGPGRPPWIWYAPQGQVAPPPDGVHPPRQDGPPPPPVAGPRGRRAPGDRPPLHPPGTPPPR
ncbi:MAG: protein kinase [Candidatus Hydrogenedentes bacterium]|nr:protein kinase [Candidatus Hydrogenedentota bacterium]